MMPLIMILNNVNTDVVNAVVDDNINNVVVDINNVNRWC